MPDLLKVYSEKKIIQACIDKKASGIINTNKEFRLLSKALTASKKRNISTDILKARIVDFITDKNVSPKDVYAATSETIYLVKDIIKQSTKLTSDIANLDMRKVSIEDLGLLKKELNSLVKSIEYKILK